MDRRKEYLICFEEAVPSPSRIDVAGDFQFDSGFPLTNIAATVLFIQFKDELLGSQPGAILNTIDMHTCTNASS